MPALRSIALTALVFLLLVAVSDRVFLATLARPARLSDNFSSSFLAFDLAKIRDAPRATVVLGDSVLWGYHIPVTQTAVFRLRERGIAAENLAYEGGSPVNTYAMLEALAIAGVKPGRVVFNVNQKTFNAADSAYATIHPSVLPLVSGSMNAKDVALLAQPKTHDTLDARLDRGVAHFWHFYAMRTDVREALFGDVDAAHAISNIVQRFTGATARAQDLHRPTPDKFEGTYDLSALDESNVSVHFLERAADVLGARRIPAIAILTPTNHTLLHDYIDNKEYERNLAYVTSLLKRRGIRVANFDHAFRSEDFIDNDHLTARANQRLATLIAAELAKS